MSQRRKAQYHNADYWRAHITACEQSEQSQSDYCREHQLTVSTYYYWKKKLQSQNNSMQSSNELPSLLELPANFLEATSEHREQTPTAWDIELSLGNGMSLRLRKS